MVEAAEQPIFVLQLALMAAMVSSDAKQQSPSMQRWATHGKDPREGQLRLKARLTQPDPVRVAVFRDHWKKRWE